MSFIDSWKEGGKAKPFRSNSYHRYFEKHTEIKIPDKSRKGYRVERIYTGEYYVQEPRGIGWKCNKLLYTAEYLFVLVLFCIIGSGNSGNNTVWYTNLSQAVSLFAMFLLLYAGLGYISAPRRMTIGQYKSASLLLISRARTAACVMWASAVCQLIYLCIPHNMDKSAAAAGAFVYAALGLILMHISVREHNMKYVLEANPAAGQVSGVEIDLE